MSDLDMRTAVRLAMPAFVTGKAVSLGVGYAAVWIHWRQPGLPAWSAVSQAFSNWDGESYQTIAENGYPSGPIDPHVGAAGHLWAFFPGFPIAVHAASLVLVNTVLTAIVLNAVFELVALAFVVRLVALERGDDESAENAAWLVAVYPYAIFLTVFYSESMFLAAAAAALYYMRRAENGDHARACLAAAVATATRVTGLALLLPIILERFLRTRRVNDAPMLLAGVIVVPVLAFMIYAHAQTGDALAWYHIEGSQSYGSRTLDWPWNGFRVTWDSARALRADQYGFIFTLEVFFGLFGLALLGVQWFATIWPAPRFPPSFALYSAAVVLPPLCLSWWISTPRYLMAMIPMYLLGADLLRWCPGLRLPFITASAALMSFGTVILTTVSFLA